MGSYKMCFCFTRTFRVTTPGPPDDIKALFRSYTDGGSCMGAEQLQRFLVEVQGESATSLSDAKMIVEQVVMRRRLYQMIKFMRPYLTLDDFHNYLFAVDLNPPIGDQVHNDMTAPLPQYYAYTGHNSYLTGNQLSSHSSDLPIIKALQRGVRVVELDIWPNSSKNDINVLHGRTLTTPVKLDKCLRSIKEYAFSASPYPLIITLEDHLPQDLQAKVAKMVSQTFGAKLFYPDVKSLKKFPSPEELKHRIIISTKPPQNYLEARGIKNQMNTPEKKNASDINVCTGDPSNLTAVQVNEEKSDIGASDDSQDEDVFDSRPFIAPAYKRLIAIPSGKPKGGLKGALKVEPGSVRRLSLSEQALEKAAASYGKQVVRFTQKNFLRVYPKGTRFNSSNYKPLMGWMHGAQMIAFNMQGYGRSLWLMHGMFRSNGECGYVKKPDFLLNVGPEGQVFDPKEKLPVKKILKVKVYMGDGWHQDFNQTHFDKYSPPDFYTRIGIAGVPADKKMKKTKKEEDNWTPVWNEEYTFPLTVPELALLRIEVREYDISDKNDFAGQTCLPIPELRPGIRAVPLYNHKGEKYRSVRLLMRFQFI